MRFLLDTHAFLWFISGDSDLSDYARRLVENPANERYLSVASLWEVAIKTSLGKLDLGQSMADLVRDHVQGNAIELLGIEPNHLDVVAGLPFRHKDPFDRLIVAQSLAEGMPVISRDSVFDEYGVSRIWKGLPLSPS